MIQVALMLSEERRGAIELEVARLQREARVMTDAADIIKHVRQSMGGTGPVTPLGNDSSGKP
jgi:hypothetical protein